ncbi:MAG TPA: carbohydrate kinase family protein [Thermoplasmatales archaeon]|nr:carbohydrate kinase family protein [Thermoplasmatales archaeon]
MSLLVVGNIAYDMIGDVRFLPNKNQATAVENLLFSNGGCAGNVAVAASKLGVKTALYSAVGYDFKDSGYLQQLLSLDVDVSFLQYVDDLTARSFIFTDKEESQQIYYYPGASAKLDAGNFDCKGFSHVHFTAGEISVYKGLMEKASEMGCVVSFDPGQEMFHRPIREQIMSCLPFASYLFFNEYEVKYLLNKVKGEDVHVFFSEKTRAIVVSRGEKGATLYLRDKTVDVPAVKTMVVRDPTGAGDAHRAGFLAGVIKGYDEEVACKVGAVVSSFVIQEKGTQTSLPSWEEMRKVYLQYFGEMKK